jgi:plasmid stabilization system protein ParE
VGRITWTDEAERWLEDIFEHIAIDDSNAASRVINDIYERAQVLKAHPEIGYRYQASSREVRILLYGHYRITYLVKESKDVEVLGVFHGALDISKYSI